MKKYIQPRNYVVNLVTESLLTSMSANSGRDTDDLWTNKKGQFEEEKTPHPIWGETEF